MWSLYTVLQDEDEWLLYIFAEGMTRPQVPPHFPPLVEAMLREPRTTVDYKTQRRMWAHAIFFLHREARLLTLLMQAQKVSMLVAICHLLRELFAGEVVVTEDCLHICLTWINFLNHFWCSVQSCFYGSDTPPRCGIWNPKPDNVFLKATKSTQVTSPITNSGKM